MAQPTIPTLNGKGFEITKFVLPLVLAIAGAWGTIKYTSGETNQKLTDLESRVKANADKIEKLNDRTVSRDELKQFIEQSRSDLKDMKEDLRALRK